MGVGFLIAGGLDEAGGQQHRNNTIAKLLAPEGDGATGDYFGRAVDIDGNYAVVGAKHSDNYTGAVYVFERAGELWTGPTKLTAYDAEAHDRFGTSVAISGNYILVGTPRDSILGDHDGSVYIFERIGGNWEPNPQKLKVPITDDDNFGYSVSVAGDYAIVGAPGSDLAGTDYGCAYIYQRVPPGGWTLTATLTASDGSTGDQFGRSVSIDSIYAVVGAPVADGAADSTGAAYVFESIAGVWGPNETAKLTASDGSHIDFFGVSVSVSGDRVVVGALEEAYPLLPKGNGAAYVFEKPGSEWVDDTETLKLTAYGGEPHDYFGYSVDIYGDDIIVGAPFDDDLMGRTAGCVYIYNWSGVDWIENKIRAADADTSDYFGRSVAITGGFAVGGADGDDEYGESSGCAYVIDEPYSDDRYFVHMADLHAAHDDNVWGDASRRWEKELKEVLRLRPPPEFVTAAGDLVEYGEWSKGRKNYNALVGSSYLDIHPMSGINYLRDNHHEIRIFFSPGNHDYRVRKYGPTRTSLVNYKDKVCFDLYYHDIVGPYAVYSLNTQHDWFSDINDFLPEGWGISDTDRNSFARDLDLLDENEDYMDTSEFTKIVLMHHPHDSRKKFPLDNDGEFEENKSEYVTILGQYNVDFAVYGHLHKNRTYSVGGTECFITEAAEDGAHREIALCGGSPSSLLKRLWGLFNVTFYGDVDTYGTDQWGNTTRLYPPDTSMVELGIPDSKYYYYYTDEYTGEPGYLSKISVIQADTMDYTFVAEARSADFMTVNVEVIRLDGSNSDLWYEGIPMAYEETGNPQGSIATLFAPASVGGYQLVVKDPDGTIRRYFPIVTLVEDDNPVPAGLKLYQNYPNPFNPTTVIRYDLPTDGRVKLEIYNVRGQRVITLIDEYQNAGSKTVTWNGTDRKGVEVASGVYFYRLREGSNSEIRKMVLLR